MVKLSCPHTFYSFAKQSILITINYFYIYQISNIVFIFKCVIEFTPLLLNTSLYSDFDNPINSNIAFGGGYTEEPIPIIPTACNGNVSSSYINQSILLPTELDVGTYEW